MYLKNHDKGRFQVEVSGYLARLDVNGVSKICLITGENDVEDIEELVFEAGYDPESILKRRLLITIEDEI